MTRDRKANTILTRAIDDCETVVVAMVTTLVPAKTFTDLLPWLLAPSWAGDGPWHRIEIDFLKK